jgi:hypothetical protein
MSEKLVKDALKKYLKSIGAYYYMPVSMGYGSTSIDFFVCHKGRFYGIETKREVGGIVTPRQKEVLRQIAESGGGVIVENSTGLERTKSVLQP